MKLAKDNSVNFLKGFAMGVANVIPGVSGGTIALITGIFERLINSLKSLNITALRLLLKGKFKELADHIDFMFLLSVLLGVLVSVFTVAKLLTFLFLHYPIFIWSYFFGLIVASVWLVGKTISKPSLSVVLFFIIGTAIAISITVLSPARENDSFFYIVICGVVAVCSMILPGISGSFVLVLMGNYELVLRAITDFNFVHLSAIGLGVVVGLPMFSHLLSWLYGKYKDQTVSILAGFILGSLSIIWPWKDSFGSAGEFFETNKFGAFISNAGSKVFSYERIMPDFDWMFFVALLIAVLGFFSIYLLERKAGDQNLDK
jgi:putative membrane protein